ncbi:MAG: hypothetical protein HYX82_00685 [Chloroflexi bacterium]|nr:hypothetical protein [Chloroflexota bacterium]
MAVPTSSDFEQPIMAELGTTQGGLPSRDLFSRIVAKQQNYGLNITPQDMRQTDPSGQNTVEHRFHTELQILKKKGRIEGPIGGTGGVWRVKGLTLPPVVPTPTSQSPDDPHELLVEITSRAGKLAELAKKTGEGKPRPTHDEVVEMVKEMGQILGKVVEKEWGPIYKHDGVWKDKPYDSPRLVVEVCDKGNLDKDIASLSWAVQNWLAKCILVTFEDADFQAAKNKLPPQAQIYPLKVGDMLTLHSAVKAGNLQAMRAIFGI